jgi:aspartyl-tRNA(Asn)/glutamyl-tRNA(Gln) amidotransferase subunit B
MAWEVVIGLETHVQLSTKSKIFSGSSTQYGAAPNTQANPVDMALPGVLPVMNKAAVECAIKLGLALGSKIAPESQFERKNYFYPDLPKAYQISQQEVPVVQGGSMTITTEAGEKTVRLVRAHLEEDAGKSVHEGLQGDDGGNVSGIDLNRTGTPLLEVVTEPDMRSAKEAVAYAKQLHALVQWIGICDGNMQEGSFRCDANVSVRRPGEPLGTRCEIKNLNSFRFMEDAINYEVRRQIELIEDGGKVRQETRLYDPDKGETRSMRSKEDAHDYRYFPDPDLPPLVISEEWVERVKKAMPELPGARGNRYMDKETQIRIWKQQNEIDFNAQVGIWVEQAWRQMRAKLSYGLNQADARQLTSDAHLSDYFELAVQSAPPGQARTVANWILGEFSAALNRDNLDVRLAPVKAPRIGQLVARIADGTISTKIAKEIFSRMWSGECGGDVDTIIESQGLKQISDTGAIEKIIDEVLAANQKSVDDYKSGKEKAFGALVGQAMKATKGKANPATVNELLKKKLGA